MGQWVGEGGQGRVRGEERGVRSGVGGLRGLESYLEGRHGNEDSVDAKFPEH